MKSNLILKKIEKKGLIETLVYGCQLLFYKLVSILMIFLLRLRGYIIAYNVVFRGATFLFQSRKYAITISDGSILGKNTRISCGDIGKIEIGKKVLIDDFTYIMAHEMIQIGSNTKIAAFCFITDFNHKYNFQKKSLAENGYETRPVNIGENVWLGTHVIILPGVSIGKGAVIGAGSVVTKNIPAYSVAVGNPAKIIKIIKKVK